MKIALVEWAPRICGPTAWLEHLRPGLAALGHQADLVTFSRSGKWLAAWSPRPGQPWAVRKLSAAVDVLNSYDLVIFADIVCRMPGLRKDGLVDGMPYYVDVVRRMRTPWTTLVHDHIYPTDENDVIKASLESPSWSGYLQVTRIRTTPPRIDPLAPRRVSWVHDPYLPYADPFPSRRRYGDGVRNAVLMLGRVTSNKGQAVAWSVIDRLKADLEIWGYNGFGLPSSVWRLYELGLALGYAEDIHPRVSRPLKHPNAKKFYTGETRMITPGGHRAWYRGSPASVLDVDWSPAIGLFLTNTSLGGSMEYAALDAIHAGLAVTMPTHQISQSSYETIPTFRYTTGTVDPRKDGSIRSSAIAEEVDDLVSQVEGMLSSSLDELQRLADAQHAEVSELHAPAAVARRLLAGMGL